MSKCAKILCQRNLSDIKFALPVDIGRLICQSLRKTHDHRPYAG